MSTLIDTMIEDVRQASNMEGHTNFIDDDEVIRYLNIELYKLYDLTIKSDMHEFFLEDYDISTVSGTEEYALPADFRRVRSVEIDIGLSRPVVIRPFNFRDRHDYVEAGWSHYEKIRYRIRNDKTTNQILIRLAPPPAAVHSVKVWYYPTLPAFETLGADTFPFPEEYEDWVILGAAIRCLRKEQNETTELERERMRVEQELLITSHMRNMSEPDIVTDVSEDWPVF